MSGQPFRVRFGLDAENQLVSNVADPRAAGVGDQDAINLRTFLSKAGIKFAARVANLPSPSDPDLTLRPTDGVAYLIKSDLAGNTLNRLAVWSSSGTTTGPVAEVEVIEPAGDAAAITAAAGTSDPGNAFDAGAGTGAVLDFVAQASGQITATIIAPGTGYAIGDSLSFPASSMAFLGMTGTTKVVVTRLAGATPLGGWQFVALKDWIKTTKAATDHKYGQEPGDIQFTTEKDHEEIKVWTGTTWKIITSTDDIKAWIAALSLFEGTVKQVGGAAVPGAVELTALVNLADTTAPGQAAGLAKNSHYWTWVGQAGYTITTADPNGVGRDLDGAIMQVGDWLQIANRGTAAAPDMRWVHIGGDLLAKSRADVLYGLNDFVYGSYESGSLVNYKGSLWKAAGIVTYSDGAPGQSGDRATATITVPFNAAVTTGRSYAVAVTYDGTALPVQTFTAADGASNAEVLAALRDWFTNTYTGRLFGDDSAAIDSIDVATFETGKTLAVTLTGTGLANAAVVVADVTLNSPWQKIDLTAGVHNVPTDGDLPATAPAEDVYLVLNSVIAGGKPGLFAYDPGASRWILLGGDSGKALKLTGGDLMLGVGCPIGTIIIWASAVIPAGWLLCDGQAFSATAYPELSVLFPTNTVPDFRGTFLRGAGQNANGEGSTIRAPGSHQGQATARPNQDFTGKANNDGAHVHTSVVSPNRGSGGGVTWDGSNIGANPPNTGSSGAHTHTVTVDGGGDLETRPANFAVNYLIKALDNGITRRP